MNCSARIRKRFWQRSANLCGGSEMSERCELCSAEVAAEHPHLIEPGSRKLLCTCNACAILFSGMGTKYKRVPRRVLALSDFHLTDGQWESLMIPISMAFFFRSTPDARVVAFYPSPAGATESLLPLETWKDHRGRKSCACEKWNPTSKLCSSIASDTSADYAAAGILRAPDRRMLQAGRPDSRQLAWPFRRNRSLAGDRAVF